MSDLPELWWEEGSQKLGAMTLQRSWIWVTLTSIFRMRSLRDYSEEIADIEVGLPVERAVEGEGRIAGNTPPGGPVASVMHVGPYHEEETCI